MRTRWEQQKRHSLRFTSSIFICLALCFVSLFATASPKKILVLASKNTDTYQQVIDVIESRLDASTDYLHIDIAYASEESSILQQDAYDLLITIGTDAAKKVLATEQHPPIISIFIPKRSFDLLTASHQHRLVGGRLTGLYLDQPLQRQLNLLKLVAPKIKSLGTVFSKNSKTQIQTLEALTQQNQLTLYASELQQTNNPVEVLTPIINSSDAFLALPDRAVFNRGTAKWILLMTFRQRIPLIAFSKSYVEAGALAAIYSTPETVGEETAALIMNWITMPNKRLPTPAYPQLFDISINQGTAKSLQLKLPPQQQIKEALIKEQLTEIRGEK